MTEEKKVLDKKEIEEISKVKEKYVEMINYLGEISLQIMDLDLRKENIKGELIQLKKEETELMDSLENKYGKGRISLESGEFLPEK